MEVKQRKLFLTLKLSLRRITSFELQAVLTLSSTHNILNKTLTPTSVKGRVDAVPTAGRSLDDVAFEDPVSA